MKKKSVKAWAMFYPYGEILWWAIAKSRRSAISLFWRDMGRPQAPDAKPPIGYRVKRVTISWEE